MTGKQKLAIKRLELNKNTEIYVDYKQKEKTDDIQVVLDLLKEKNKSIDLMADEFKEKTLMYSDFTKEEIKQYFESKVKEKNND